MGLFVLAALLTYEPPPSSSRIVVLQEAQARLQSRSSRAEQPLKIKPTAAEHVLSSQERNELHQSIETFVRDRAGQVLDLR
jgi:hypothetical protein